MAVGAHYIKTDLENLGILTKAFELYPHYKLAITGMMYDISAVLWNLQKANTSTVYLIKLNLMQDAFHFL